MKFEWMADFLRPTGPLVDSLASILLALAALGCLVFVATYTFKADWRVTPLGRHMFYFGWAVVFAYAVGLARTIYPDQNWLDYVRLVSLSTVVFVFWQRVFLLWRCVRPRLPKRPGAGAGTRHRVCQPGTWGPAIPGRWPQ